MFEGNGVQAAALSRFRVGRERSAGGSAVTVPCWKGTLSRFLPPSAVVEGTRDGTASGVADTAGGTEDRAASSAPQLMGALLAQLCISAYGQGYASRGFTLKKGIS